MAWMPSKIYSTKSPDIEDDASMLWHASGTKKRILMLAACPYPSPLGTPVCIRQLAYQQAASGHVVHIVTYASPAAPNAVFYDGATVCHAVPGAQIAPRSGPQRAKWGADARLWRYARRLGKAMRFDLLYGHHAEGIVLGWLLQRSLNLPLIGHLHTRLGLELPGYLTARCNQPASTQRPRRALNKLQQHACSLFGHLADRTLPKLVDALVTLSVADAAACAPYAQKDHIFVRYPALAATFAQCPHSAAHRSMCASTERYVIYSGNADRYQNLALLCSALRLHPQPCVLATHGDTTVFDAYPWPEMTRIVRVDSFEQMQYWLRGASVGVCPRVQACGYPIKWLNYWQAGLRLVAIKAVGQAVFGARLNTNVHGPAIWIQPVARALSRAITQQAATYSPQQAWRSSTNDACLQNIIKIATANYYDYNTIEVSQRSIARDRPDIRHKKNESVEIPTCRERYL